MIGEQGGDQLGLAQRLDDVLFRLETWRPSRQVLATTFCGLAVLALGLGWWFGRAANGEPVEESIPLAAGAAIGDGTDAGAQTEAENQTDRDGEDSVTVPAEPSPSTSAGPAETDAQEMLVVHVIGAVARPGLVSVDDGARIDDVVAAAGGATGRAALDRLNLAAPVVDGMQVRVPAIDEDADEELVVLPPTATTGKGEPEALSGPVNLNTASAEQLDTLPGVGPATAAAILRWREENGGFHSLEDLLAVPGIGQAKMAAIRDLVTV